MPDPPQFVNYSSAEGAPLTSSASKVTSRPAQFARSTQRRLPNVPPPQSDDEQPFVNTAGVGAGNRASGPGPIDPVPGRATNLSRASTRRNTPQTNGNGNANGATNGFSPGSSPPATASRNAGNFAASQAAAQPVNPTQHELVVGDNTYKVDLSKDQQANNSRGSAAASKVGDETDPMVQAMANLRTAAGASVGRSVTRKITPDPSGAPGGSSSTSPSKVLAPPTSISPQSRNVDYRNSAEIVVGAHPATQPPSSRSTSPVPPTATFMQPPSQTPAPVVDAVIDSYHQSFPGERRSRSNSRRASFNNAPPQLTAAPSHGHGSHLDRPVSREGHAGIGANGRSRSPSLNRHGPASRSVSPAPPGPPRGGSVNPIDQGPGQYRATTPNTNSVGISLDPHGNVAVDAMADAYRQQQQQQVAQARQIQQAQAPQPMQPPAPAPVPYQQAPSQPQQLQAPGGVGARPPMQRQPSIGQSFGVPGAWQTGAASPQQQYVPPPPAQQQVPQHSPAYVQAPHPYANAPPSQVYHAPQVNYGMQPTLQQQQQQQRQQRGATGSNGGEYYEQQGYASQQQQQQPPQQYQQLPQHQRQHIPYGGGGYLTRTPSPKPMALTQTQPQPLAEPPTQQYTEDGRGVLFYGAAIFVFFCLFVLRGGMIAVRALYDYSATIPEEFDFQREDIIAVTATPEDGWWSGELLDESRRVPGRHIFPSNFVHLF